MGKKQEATGVSAKATGGRPLRPRLIALSVVAAFSFAGQSIANPGGATVVSGSASFGTAGNALTVTNSANAIINWQSFSIGVNEVTRFVQPSAASAVLNRVIGSGGVLPQSVIDGVLSSNGRVFLLNPAGVVFGAGAQIDVAGLVASSLNMTNEDFLNGRMRFTEIPGAGAITNNGSITTPSGGRVFLVGPEVTNGGVVRSPQGQVVLAAGKSVELFSENTPFVTVRLTADTEKATNLGSLIADSGKVGVFGALVRNAGVAEANSVVTGANGEVRFVATRDVTLDAGSRISANGPDGGKVLVQAQNGTALLAGTVEAKGTSGKGGEVQALGIRVGVIGNGIIDASGETGGGSVMIGGDYQGGNVEVQNAERTYIGPDGVIRADAKSTGDGGRVIVWADGDTRFFGSISAQGGAQQGNGGFVETSGKQFLSAQGVVDTRAPQGRSGTWLLDPTDITIVSGNNNFTDDQFVYGGDYVFAFSESSGSSTISNGAIAYGVQRNGDVSIQATRDITLQASVDTSAYAGSLTLKAGNNIKLGAFDITTKGNLTLSANDTGYGTSSGSGIVSGTGTLKTGGGRLSIYGNGISLGDMSTTSSSYGYGGNIYIGSGAGGIGIYGSISSAATTYGGSYGGATAGTITLDASGGSLYASGSISAYGANGGSALTSGNGSYGGAGNVVTLSASSGVSVTGAINTWGGDGYGGSYGGVGGAAGSISISGGPITVSNLYAYGGNGGSGNTAGTVYGSTLSAGSGGAGASIFLTGSGTSDVTVGGTSDSHGGSAGTSSGGSGGAGGKLTVSGGGVVSLNGVVTSGGTGAGTTSTTIAGGSGASAGSVDISGGSVAFNGKLVALGGTGGSGATAGAGGAGGKATLSGKNDVSLTGSIALGCGTAAGASTCTNFGTVAFSSSAGAVNVNSDVLPAGFTAKAATVFRYNTQSGSIGINQNFFNGITAPLLIIGSTTSTPSMTLSGPINVGSQNLSLLSSGQIFSDGGITAAGLNLDGASVSVSGANTVGILQGRARAGNFLFSNTGALSLGTADSGNGQPGVSATGLLTLVAGGNITSNINGAYALKGAAVQIASINGAIGSSTAPLQIGTTVLEAIGSTGVSIALNSFSPAFSAVNTLKNTGKGDILLLAYGGAMTTSLVDDPGGNISIKTFSPLQVLSGANAGGSLAFETSGADSNTMLLDGTFTNTTGFRVTVGPGSLLVMGSGFKGTITEQFGGKASGTLSEILAKTDVFQAVNQTTNSVTSTTTQVGTGSSSGSVTEQEEKKEQEKKGAAICKP